MIAERRPPAASIPALVRLLAAPPFSRRSIDAWLSLAYTSRSIEVANSCGV